MESTLLVPLVRKGETDPGPGWDRLVGRGSGPLFEPPLFSGG